MQEYEKAANQYIRLIPLTNEKNKIIEFIELIAQCYEFLNEKQNALDYYIQSAKIRKEDPDAEIETEATQQSIKACIRLAKELGKEGELPGWMDEINKD